MTEKSGREPATQGLERGETQAQPQTAKTSSKNIEPRLCRLCKQPIHKEARICHVCGRGQHPILNPTNLSSAASATSILVLILSFMQFSEAKKEANKAQAASEVAEAANQEVQEAQKDISNLKKALISDMIGEFRTDDFLEILKDLNSN